MDVFVFFMYNSFNCFLNEYDVYVIYIVCDGGRRFLEISLPAAALNRDNQSGVEGQKTKTMG